MNARRCLGKAVKRFDVLFGTRLQGAACSSRASKVILAPVQTQEWVFIKGGCSRRGVQWMGVVLHNKIVYNIIEITTPCFHCTPPPLMNLKRDLRGLVTPVMEIPGPRDLSPMHRLHAEVKSFESPRRFGNCDHRERGSPMEGPWGDLQSCHHLQFMRYGMSHLLWSSTSPIDLRPPRLQLQVVGLVRHGHHDHAHLFRMLTYRILIGMFRGALLGAPSS